MPVRLKIVSLLTIVLMSALAACSPAPAPSTAPAEPTAAPAEPTIAPAEAPAAQERTGIRTYVIVPEESTASYIVDEEFFGAALSKYGIPAGLVDTVGATQAVEGQFQLNWDDLSSALGENRFRVDLSTLKSNQSLRDGWIRDNGPEFGRYPDAIFVAEGLANVPTQYSEGDEVNFQMVGQITIREITQPATFDVTASLQGDTVTGTAVATLRMTDFGFDPPNFVDTLTVADEFQVRIEFTAREQ